jgi:hypothetical protein
VFFKKVLFIAFKSSKFNFIGKIQKEVPKPPPKPHKRPNPSSTDLALSHFNLTLFFYVSSPHFMCLGDENRKSKLLEAKFSVLID